MTVKELAQFTGKSETTVQRWVKKANCKMQLCNNKMQLQRGHETDFKLEEVEAILNSSSMSKDAVSILIANAKKSQQRDCGSMLTQKDMAAISAVVRSEVEAILNSSSMSKDAVSILIANAKKSQQRDCGSMLTQKDMAAISAVVSMTISQIMTPMNERISKLENGVNALPEPEYYSIIGYANKHGVRVDIHGALELSKRAKQLSISEHKDIRKIPDERWGQVNSYSVSVLKELFEV